MTNSSLNTGRRNSTECFYLQESDAVSWILLKKTVNYITELAAGLCLVESANANAEKREAYSEVFLQIINLRNDIISRISHTEPGSVKLFYKKLRADFNAEVDNVFKKLEELSK